MANGFAYRGIEDFLLHHGIWYRPNGKIPPKQGAPKQCFGNALLNAALYGVSYIEGVALAGKLLVPMHHGWNLDMDDELCDTTWMNTGAAYLGVEFSMGRADNAMWFDDATVLDNPRNRFKLYREPWQGENHNLYWRKSKQMRRILKIR